MIVRHRLMAPEGDAGGAGGGSDGAGAGAGGGSGTGDSWTASIEDAGLRGWAESRQWSSPADALKAHQELEKMRGVPAQRLLTLPENADDKDAWSAIYGRLGRPDAPEGYELPTVEGGEGGLDLTPDFRGWAHQAGLSQPQAKALAEAFNARMQAVVQSREQELAERATVEEGELKRAWGQEYDANVITAKKAATTLGLKDTEVDALQATIGYRRTFELFQRIGKGIAEFAPADEGTSSNGFGVTPEAARAQLDQLKGDRAFMDDVVANPRGPAAAKYDRLHRIAYA